MSERRRRDVIVANSKIIVSEQEDSTNSKMRRVHNSEACAVESFFHIPKLRFHTDISEKCNKSNKRHLLNSTLSRIEQHRNPHSVP